MPLKYSIAWLICAVACGREAVVVGWPGAAQDHLSDTPPALGRGVSRDASDAARLAPQASDSDDSEAAHAAVTASSWSAQELTVPFSVTVPFELSTETLDASSRALRRDRDGGTVHLGIPGELVIDRALEILVGHHLLSSFLPFKLCRPGCWAHHPSG